jgi:hypothetical protein
MKEQIGMVLTVGWQYLGEDHVQDRPGLLYVPEGTAAARLESLQLGAKALMEDLPGLFRTSLGKNPIGIANLSLKARIGFAAGKVEVAQ